MLKEYVKNTTLFGVGALLGIFAGYKYAEHKYQEKIEEEIKQARDLYSKKIAEINKDTKEYVSNVMKEVPVEDENDILKEKSTISYDKASGSDMVAYQDYYPKKNIPEKEEEVVFENETSNINFIEENEFLDINGYTKFNYILYTDGTVTDITDGPSNEEIVDDAEMLLGSDNIDDILRGRRDIVWLRNELQNADFEINKEIGTYEEVVGKSPHSNE